MHIPISERFKVGERIRIRKDSEYEGQNEPEGLIITAVDPDYFEYCINTASNTYRHKDVEYYSKFKVGDIVIGNKGSNQYGVTTEGWVGKVTNIYLERAQMELEKYSSQQVGHGTYSVRVDTFDLVDRECELCIGDTVMILSNLSGTSFSVGDILTVNNQTDGRVVVEKNEHTQYIVRHELALLRKAPKNLKVELSVFPKEGWCPDAPPELGRYLAKIKDDSFIAGGFKGYAWNSFSYWSINSTSGKSTYFYKDLRHFVLEDKKAKTNLEVSPKYKVGDILRVTQAIHGHAFKIGQKVEIIEINISGRIRYNCKALNSGKDFTWWLGAEELSLIEVPVDSSSYEWDLASIKPTEPVGHLFHVEGHIKDKEVSPDKNELVSRVAKPTIFFKKKESINKGLIVSLNPIKSRIIK